MGVNQRWVRYFPDAQFDFDDYKNMKGPKFDLESKLKWNQIQMDRFQLIAFEQK